LAGLLLAAPALAQQPRVDLGVTYTAERSLRAATGQNFWMQGGAIELGANVWRGWGIAADVEGTHANSIGASGIPISLVTATFGVRYRMRAERKLSPYGEVLAGEANGFHSLFPSPFGSVTNANGLAVHVGGGLDYRWKTHVAVRLLDAAWVRTELPNATDNVQNNLRLGAGVVLRFGR
jgi:hypothetical protein